MWRMSGESGGKGKAIFKLPVRRARYTRRNCASITCLWQALFLKILR